MGFGVSQNAFKTLGICGQNTGILGVTFYKDSNSDKNSWGPKQ